MGKYNFSVIDSHVHITEPKCLNFMREYCSEHNFSYINLACLGQKSPNDHTQNMLAGLLKLQDERFFAHGSLTYPGLPVTGKVKDNLLAADQAKRLMGMGFDGMKMLEGKPTTRKALGLAQDDPILFDYYSFLEKNKVHIVWHVADPETFWVKETAPEFAFSSGWFYGDGTFQTKQQLYDETLAVLDRFPGLNASFAHFFFLSDFPDEAENLLEKYPAVTLDITPGREMYDYFSRRQPVWQKFFHKYADRIVFGTDMTSTEFQGKADEMIEAMKRFLATTDVFEYWDFTIRGLGLDQADCQKICHDNFQAKVSTKPEKINKKDFSAYVKENIDHVADQETWAYITVQLRRLT
jgi:predicted TIM-barrel fold metal-dependent hydrolase